MTFILVIANIFLIIITGGLWLGVLIIWALVKAITRK